MGVPSDKEVYIEDDHGDDHLYYIQLHPAEKGLELLPKITKIAANAVIPVLSESTKGVLEDADLDSYDFGDNMGTDEIEDMIKDDLKGSLDFSDLDSTKLTGAINAFVDELVAAGNFRFIKKLLKHTERCKVEEKNPVSVTQGNHFNMFYTGNYGELFRVLRYVIKHNFGPALSSTLGVQL